MEIKKLDPKRSLASEGSISRALSDGNIPTGRSSSDRWGAVPPIKRINPYLEVPEMDRSVRRSDRTLNQTTMTVVIIEKQIR
jgi:hypothetical protein